MPSSALRSRRVWRMTLAMRRLRARLRTIVSARYSRGPQPWARLPIRLLIPVQTGDPTTTRQTRLESGDEGNRTPDPRLAKAVLYQLSYVPWHNELLERAVRLPVLARLSLLPRSTDLPRPAPPACDGRPPHRRPGRLP